MRFTKSAKKIFLYAFFFLNDYALYKKREENLPIRIFLLNNYALCEKREENLSLRIFLCL